MERRREVYCRWSCVLRYSGGLWEGGWVGGKRAIGGMDVVVWSIGGAGVIAEAVERCLWVEMEVGLVWRWWRQREQMRRRGGIVLEAASVVR